MKTKFEQALEFTLRWEGGYANDKKDPGGETKYGISDRGDGTIDGAFLGKSIKDLSLNDAIEFYRTQYWDVNGLDNYDLPLAVCLFDSFVQHRPTVVKSLLNECEGSWTKFLQLRKFFYAKLIAKNPAMKKYEKGWINRMNDLSKYAQILAQDQTI